MTVALHSGERAAQDARQQYGLDATERVADLLELVESTVKVPVLVERFHAEDIAGVLLRRADGTSFIGVNADHQPPRQRFTLAHELGHLWLGHQPRVDFVVNLTEGRSSDTQEVEANYFAAEFLCPRLAVVAWLQNNELGDAIDASVVARLALEFGLSLQTASIRLERAGAISANKKTALLREVTLAPGRFIRQFQGLRLRDEIERLCTAKDYPRAPKPTVHYAERAREDGLIGAEEFSAIVPHTGAMPDIAAWFG